MFETISYYSFLTVALCQKCNRLKLDHASVFLLQLNVFYQTSSINIILDNEQIYYCLALSQQFFHLTHCACFNLSPDIHVS